MHKLTAWAAANPVRTMAVVTAVMAALAPVVPVAVITAVNGIIAALLGLGVHQAVTPTASADRRTAEAAYKAATQVAAQIGEASAGLVGDVTDEARAIIGQAVVNATQPAARTSGHP